MEKKLRFRDYLCVGSMLFGLFFGAGNLIFPVHMGQEAGSNIFMANLGFLVTGIGLPFLGVVAIGVSRSNGLFDLASRINKRYALIFTVLLYLVIGPFFALPRLATTSFEIGLAPFLPQAQHQLFLALFSLLFFITAWALSRKPSKLLVYVGKFLNPVFLLLLGVLLAFAFFKPLGSIADAPIQVAYQHNVFVTGFTQGYNTLDALASVAFSVVAVVTLNQLGFKSKKEYISTIWVVGFVVTLLFGALYLGLAFLGNHFPLQVADLPKDANIGASVLSQATQAIFGPAAQIFLAIMVTVTCFTTTAGLIVATGEFFHKAFPKVSYKAYAIIFTLIGFAIANLGLNNIIAFSVPVLLILYPITITIVMIVIANKFVALSKPGMQMTVAVVTLIALLSVLGSQFKLTGLNALINFLPLSGASLPWLIPAILCILLSLILPDKIKSESFEME